MTRLQTAPGHPSGIAVMARPVPFGAPSEAPHHPPTVGAPSPFPIWGPHTFLMSYTSRILRAAWTANRVERAVRNPVRYARNRAKSKTLSAIGFWRLFRRFWRA